jgi:peptidoglycan-associated lipoprotein
MRERKGRRAEVLVSILGLLLIAGACHQAPKKVVAPPPPPPPPPPPAAAVCTLSAEPTTVEKGQSVTLNWTSQNATDLDLQPAVGKVQASGSQSVTPSDSTTYTLTATGAGGSTSCTARVTVTAPPPPPPPPPPQVSEEDLFNQNMKTAYFDFDKSNIRPDAQQALQADADFLKQHPNIKFTLEGNCDERGSEEYNLGLGQRRADAAKKFLTDSGISGDNITTISYGKDRPVCTDHNEDCWQRNRNAKPVYGTESQPQK